VVTGDAIRAASSVAIDSLPLSSRGDQRGVGVDGQHALRIRATPRARASARAPIPYRASLPLITTKRRERCADRVDHAAFPAQDRANGFGAPDVA
jgi:hypothetical protein